jgi:chromosome segregation ATPase
VASLLLEGSRDLRRRVRIVWLSAVRFRLRRTLFEAETELGWLGWEQVDFYDEELNAHVKIVQDFEHTQASLLNTSAELSGQQVVLEEELAGETAAHDRTQAALAAERAPLSAQLEQSEATRRLKLESGDRFARALDEIASLEKRLEAESLEFMNLRHPNIQVRIEARKVSDELGRLSAERKLVMADQANAALEAAALESVVTRLRAELHRIDSAADAARDALAAASRRHAGEARPLEDQKKKSDLRMAHLDREKKTHYRIIGACLANEGVAPRNQPEILTKVFTLRDEDLLLTQTLTDLRAACTAYATAHPGKLIAFYMMLAMLLLALLLLALNVR